MSNLPIVGISTCFKPLEFEMEHYCSRSSYCDAVLEGSNAMPLLVPSMGGEMLNQKGIFNNIDGLLLTGSISNVNPKLFGQEPVGKKQYLDDVRDQTTIPLIKIAVKMGVPILAVCRGFQEFNVAFGGDLHQKIHDVEGKRDHRTNMRDETARKNGAFHSVKINQSGLLEKIILDQNINMPEDRKFEVNTSHSQGIKSAGNGLFIDAVSDDGVIEAMSVKGAKSFALGLQWHPEKDWNKIELHKAIFKEFGNAVEKYRDSKSK
jgi:putative glutamine amidotransferase